MQSHNTPDKQAVVDSFLTIRDAISKQDTEAVRQCVKTLSGGPASPQFIMDLLSNFLFHQQSQVQSTAVDNEPVNLSNLEALSILGVLVSIEQAKYFKPASISVVKEAKRLLSSLDETMFVSPELMNVMIQQLESQDVEVSSNAEEALVACCQKVGPSLAVSALQATTDAWKQSKATETTNSKKRNSHTTTVWVRCASAIVSIACLEDSNMASAISCGAMDLVLELLLDSSDPLLQMSTMDLIDKLASTTTTTSSSNNQPSHHHRSEWLFSEKVLQPLLIMAGGGRLSDDLDGGDNNDDPCEPDPIMGGPALRLIAVLCVFGHKDRTLFNMDKRLLGGFHQALYNFVPNGEVDRLAMIDAISSFASASEDALDLVLTDPVTRQAWLSLNVAQPKLKAVILHSVAMVMDPSFVSSSSSLSGSPSPPSSAEEVDSPRILSNAMGMKLFSELGKTNGEEIAPSALLLGLAKSPLPETRLGAYAMLRSLVKLSTGAQVVLSHPGCYEFLISREGEPTKEGREAKYAIVQAILASNVKALLAESIVRAMEQYVKQGPHYVKTMSWELATDENA